MFDLICIKGSGWPNSIQELQKGYSCNSTMPKRHGDFALAQNTSAAKQRYAALLIFLLRRTQVDEEFVGPEAVEGESSFDVDDVGIQLFRPKGKQPALEGRVLRLERIQFGG